MKKKSWIFLFLIALNLCPDSSIAQTWLALDKGITGVDGQLGGVVFAMCFDSLHHFLFAGGGFEHAGIGSCSNLAMWDGQNWKCFDTNGVNFTVYALCMQEDTLYIAGQEHYIIKCLVHSDGSIETLPFPGTFNGNINSMTIFNGHLVVAGVFTKANSHYKNGIAMWKDGDWQPMAGGFAATGGVWVHNLAIYNGELIASGYFQTEANTGVAFENIARWDGANWQPLGAGLTDNDPNSYSADVTAMEVYNGELYASGNFTYINNTQYVNHFAKWDGNAWAPVGNDTYAELQDMKAYQGNLYGAGYYGVSTIGHITVLQNGAWQDLSSLNVEGTVFTTTIFNDTLYIGGSIIVYATNGDTSRSIGALDLLSIPTFVKSPFSDPSTFSFYPNPALTEINIAYSIQENAFLSITDLSGKELKNVTLFPTYTKLNINISSLKEGIYVVYIKQSDKILASQKLVIVR